MSLSPPEELRILERQLETQLNCPLTSSVGRLFDAAAALVGISPRVTYEAQAACEFEAVADRAESGGYSFAVEEGILNPIPALRELARDLTAGTPVPGIAARFHNGLADAVVRVCLGIREQYGLSRVALSGGVWQNEFLLGRTVAGLEKEAFDVLWHQRVPPNDGGLALGQAVIAAVQARRAGGSETRGEEALSPAGDA